MTVDGLVATFWEITITEDETLDVRVAERKVFALNYLGYRGTDKKQKSQDSIFVHSLRKTPVKGKNNFDVINMTAPHVLSSQILGNSRN